MWSDLISASSCTYCSFLSFCRYYIYLRSSGALCFIYRSFVTSSMFWFLLTPKFGLRWEGPKGRNYQGKSRDEWVQNWLVRMLFRVDWISITSSSQGDSSSKNGIVQDQENMMDSIEGEVWSPCYLKLGCFIFFSKFCDWSFFDQDL